MELTKINLQLFTCQCEAEDPDCGTCQDSCECSGQNNQCGTCESCQCSGENNQCDMCEVYYMDDDPCNNNQCGSCESCQCSGENNQGSSPSKPSISVTSKDYGSITFDWTTPANTEYFEVDLLNNGNFENFGLGDNIRYPGLDEGETVTIKVKACNGYGCSSVASKSATTLEHIPPSKPSNLHVTSKDHDHISLDWDNVSGAAGYKIYIDGTYNNTFGNSQLTAVNLSPSTTYQFCISAYDSYGESEKACINVTTNSEPTPSTPSDPTLYNNDQDYRYEGGFRVQWSSVSSADDYTLKVRRGYDNVTTIYTTANTYKDVTGLQYGVKYYVSVKATNSYGSSSYSNENPITTRPEKPTLNIQDTGNDYVTVKVSGITNNWTRAYVNVYTESGTFIDSAYVENGGSSTVTINRLSAGTTYKIDGRTRFDFDSTSLYSFYTSSKTFATGARPENFSWKNTSFGSGSDAIIDHDDWNNLLDKINEFKIAEGQDTIFTSFDYVSPGDKLTSAIFNKVRNAINDMFPPITPPSEVDSGDAVLASYFDGENSLVKALNSLNDNP